MVVYKTFCQHEREMIEFEITEDLNYRRNDNLSLLLLGMCPAVQILGGCLNHSVKKNLGGVFQPRRLIEHLCIFYRKVFSL